MSAEAGVKTQEDTLQVCAAALTGMRCFLKPEPCLPFQLKLRCVHGNLLNVWQVQEGQAFGCMEHNLPATGRVRRACHGLNRLLFSPG